MTPLLQLRHLHVHLSGSAIVNDICLSVAPGEFIAILGPSGCGKTTMLRAICGLEIPYSGTVEYEGVDITHVPTHQRNIGYLFQEGALFPHLTVRQNICFGIRNLPNKVQQDRLVTLLDLVQLTGLDARATTELSGGQRQRVALARALARQPKLIMLDEPFSSLDATLRASLRTELFAILRQTGTAALMVTHDKDDAESISARTIWMENGRIRSD